MVDLMKNHSLEIFKYHLKDIVEDKEIDDFNKQFLEKFKLFEEYYTKNVDLRITQALFNLGANQFNLLYNKEDHDLMVQAGVAQPREVYFWVMI